jgi:hypothetical protein
VGSELSDIRLQPDAQQHVTEVDLRVNAGGQRRSQQASEKGALEEFTEQQAATSRYLLVGLLLNDTDVLSVMRRELRRITDRLVDIEDIKQVLSKQVIKREAQEGDEAKDAARLVCRHDKKKSAKGIKQNKGTKTTDDSANEASASECE